MRRLAYESILLISITRLAPAPPAAPSNIDLSDFKDSLIIDAFGFGDLS